MGDDLFKLRMAHRVLRYPVRPSATWRSPVCAACRQPIRRECEVMHVDNLGWCHSYCGDNAVDNGDDSYR